MKNPSFLKLTASEIITLFSVSFNDPKDEMILAKSNTIDFATKKNIQINIMLENENHLLVEFNTEDDNGDTYTLSFFLAHRTMDIFLTKVDHQSTTLPIYSITLKLNEEGFLTNLVNAFNTVARFYN